jgi:hypothetical protein
MPRHLAYRVVAAVTACFLFLFGFVFLCGFIDRALFQVLAHPLFDTDPWGYYILGVAGSALIVWSVGAILRLLAWYSGEYREIGDQLRLESGTFLVLALAFIWLRPPRIELPHHE